jgi:hypothetical protein
MKKRANLILKTAGKKSSNKVVIKKASNLAAARKDRLKKEEEKIMLVSILNEMTSICHQNIISKTAKSILSLFRDKTTEKN